MNHQKELLKHADQLGTITALTEASRKRRGWTFPSEIKMLRGAAARIDELEKAAKGWQKKWNEVADARDDLWRKACLWKEDSDELMALKRAPKNSRK